MFFVVGVMTGSVYGPLIWRWYSDRIRPLTEVEKKEAQLLNTALQERFGTHIFKVRTE